MPTCSTVVCTLSILVAMSDDVETRTTRITPEQAFGKPEQALHQEQGLSQERVEVESGLHCTQTSLSEHGPRRPMLGTVFRLEDVFTVKHSELIARRTQVETPDLAQAVVRPAFPDLGPTREHPR